MFQSSGTSECASSLPSAFRVIRLRSTHSVALSAVGVVLATLRSPSGPVVCASSRGPPDDSGGGDCLVAWPGSAWPGSAPTGADVSVERCARGSTDTRSTDTGALGCFRGSRPGTLAAERATLDTSAMGDLGAMSSGGTTAPAPNSPTSPACIARARRRRRARWCACSLGVRICDRLRCACCPFLAAAADAATSVASVSRPPRCRAELIGVGTGV
jgi:hypothetical protein